MMKTEVIKEQRTMVPMALALYAEVKARAQANGRCVGREVAKIVESEMLREAMKARKARKAQEVCHG